MLPKKIYLNYVDEKDDDITWSDEPVAVGDCNMQNREYTDLSQVWHSASEEPKCKELLIIYYEDIGGLPIDALIYHGSVDYPWKELVKTTGIIYWAYAKDILPKGGKK